MTDDEGKKEEEKFEFTPEREALGYIFLDQARVPAIQHARDNRDFYGPNYARRELVWDVSSAEESEDYYEVRLSFRVAGQRRREPGIEQFTVDKVGTIEVRQILSRPTKRQPSALVLVSEL